MTPRTKQKSLALHREVEEWQNTSVRLDDSDSGKRGGGKTSKPKPLISFGKLFKKKKKKKSVAEEKPTLVGAPTNFNHKLHIDYDEKMARYVGVPEEWKDVFNKVFGLPLESVPKTKMEQYEAGIPSILLLMVGWFHGIFSYFLFMLGLFYESWCWKYIPSIIKDS